MNKLAASFAMLGGLCAHQPLIAQTWITADTIASIKPVYSTIFYEDPGRWKDLPIRLDLSEPEVRALVPARPGKFAMIELKCRSISVRRHLKGCKARTEPNGLGYEPVAERLAKRVVVDPAFVRDPKLVVKFVMLEFRVVNSERPELEGPCWPPLCMIETAVPPPPPPHP